MASNFLDISKKYPGLLNCRFLQYTIYSKFPYLKSPNLYLSPMSSVTHFAEIGGMDNFI